MSGYVSFNILFLCGRLCGQVLFLLVNLNFPVVTSKVVFGTGGGGVLVFQIIVMKGLQGARCWQVDR